MTAVNFPEANIQLAEDQPEYETLPILCDTTKPEQPMTCCFKLTPEELAEINATGIIWHTQWTFGQAFQPILMTTQKPF